MAASLSLFLLQAAMVPEAIAGMGLLQSSLTRHAEGTKVNLTWPSQGLVWEH